MHPEEVNDENRLTASDDMVVASSLLHMLKNPLYCATMVQVTFLGNVQPDLSAALVN